MTNPTPSAPAEGATITVTLSQKDAEIVAYDVGFLAGSHRGSEELRRFYVALQNAIEAAKEQAK